MRTISPNETAPNLKSGNTKVMVFSSMPGRIYTSLFGYGSPPIFKSPLKTPTASFTVTAKAETTDTQINNTVVMIFFIM